MGNVMITDKKQDQVTTFFKGYAKKFDSFYQSEERPLLGKYIDKVARKSIYRRFEEAYKIFENEKVQSLLDVGCGPGYHDIIIANELGSQVVGIDVAETMINLAKEKAYKYKVDNLCTFYIQDFTMFNSHEKYDAVLSLGVVEYIGEPKFFIEKMISHCKNTVIFSIPVKWHWLTPQRIVRYKLRKCPLYFYSFNEIKKLMKKIDVENFDILHVNRDYLVVIKI
jgi:2-polyprenyl-3-methyl-5-hydroxy-6-metoxy-1,4-benzoquinol methylase